MQALSRLVGVAALSIMPLASQSDGTAPCIGSTLAEFSAHLEPKASAFLVALKNAVKAGDKLRIAGMVQYPLSVNTGKAHRAVRSSAQFLAEYDRLFTTSVRNAIERQTSECLFAKSQGVMIGDGEVWFDEQPDGSMKIKTLNIP